jgi:hypothetical protein
MAKWRGNPAHPAPLFGLGGKLGFSKSIVQYDHGIGGPIALTVLHHGYETSRCIVHAFKSMMRPARRRRNFDDRCLADARSPEGGA